MEKLKVSLYIAKPFDDSVKQEEFKQYCNKYSPFIELDWMFPFPPRVGEYIYSINDYLSSEMLDRTQRYSCFGFFEETFKITRVTYSSDTVEIDVEQSSP
jgi:hypothetical protein